MVARCISSTSLWGRSEWLVPGAGKVTKKTQQLSYITGAKNKQYTGTYMSHTASIVTPSLHLLYYCSIYIRPSQVHRQGGFLVAQKPAYLLICRWSLCWHCFAQSPSGQMLVAYCVRACLPLTVLINLHCIVSILFTYLSIRRAEEDYTVYIYDYQAGELHGRTCLWSHFNNCSWDSHPMTLNVYP